jgi:hypothetical protein
MDFIADELSPLGYRRKSALFIKSVGPNWAAIHIQRSDASDGERIKATGNVGAALGDILDFEGRGEPRSYRDLHWMVRLGELLPEAIDRWWWIEVATLPRSAVDFVTTLRDVAVPEAERHADTTRLRSLWMSGPVPFLPETDRLKRLSIVLLREQRFDLAARAADELVQRARGTAEEGEVRAFRDEVHRLVAARHPGTDAGTTQN